MKARAVRRLAVAYLGDLLAESDAGDQVEDPEEAVTALLDQAEDFRITRDGRVVITWHLDNDGSDAAPAHQEPINRPDEPDPDGGG